MITTDILESAQYLVDTNGKRTAAVVNIDAWDRLLLQLAAYRLPDAQQLASNVEWSQVITVSPDTAWGTPVFAETRVPFQALIDYLKSGDTLIAFRDNYPTVSETQLTRTLQLIKRHSGKSYASNY